MAVIEKILLVDDDDTTNFLHSRLLKRLNAAKQIAVATNGDEAINYLRSHCLVEDLNCDDCPSLILLDIKMPIMDGFEFLDEFEKIKSAIGKNIQIMMLTSSSNPLDKERITQYKTVQRQYTKPLSENTVNEILSLYA